MNKEYVVITLKKNGDVKYRYYYISGELYYDSYGNYGNYNVLGSLAPINDLAANLDDDTCWGHETLVGNEAIKYLMVQELKK